MDEKAANDALLALENGARLLRLALKDNAYRPPMFLWGGEAHVDEVVARLGVFERMHLENELHLDKTAVLKRIRSALERGVLVEIMPAKSNRQAVYRWTGKT